MQLLAASWADSNMFTHKAKDQSVNNVSQSQVVQKVSSTVSFATTDIVFLGSVFINCLR